MMKRFFYFLSLLVFCSLLTACPAKTETNISVNTSNNAAQNANKEQKPADQAAAGKSPEKTTTQNDASKNSETSSTSGKFENRCGWFANPTPANAWLNDKDGEWTVSVQGGYQAEGDWGDFPDDQWVKTNGNYGYGCACMSVTVDKKEMRILKISKWTARPLSACRNDPALKEPQE